MKNSLDSEPPSIVRIKEVSRKRNTNLNQLILSTKSDKNKDNSIRTGKSLEKQVRLKFQDYRLDENYMRKNNDSMEDISSTTKKLSFISALDTDSKNIISDFNYFQKINNISHTERKPSSFYEMNSSYSFIPKIIEEDRMDDSSYKPKEQETKETIYVLNNFDEEPKKED